MKRKSIQETTKKWMVYLQDLKYNLDEHNIKNVTAFADKHSICHRFGQFLKKSKVIYKNDFGFYEWNEKIPVSIKLINSYRRYQYQQNTKQNNIYQRKIEFTEKNTNDNFITIREIKEIYGKSETTVRSIVRKLKASKSKDLKIINDNGREKLLINQKHLDNVFSKKTDNKKANIVDVKNLKLYAPYKEKKVGLIRKFLRWIY